MVNACMTSMNITKVEFFSSFTHVNDHLAVEGFKLVLDSLFEVGRAIHVSV